MTDKGFKCPPPPPKKRRNNKTNKQSKKKTRNLLVHVLNCALCFQISRLLEK